MFVLYTVYVGCTAALVLTAFGIVRHVVLHRRAARSRAEHHDDIV